MPGVYTTQLTQAMAPWLAYDSNGHLYSYLVAIGSMFDAVAGIVSDQNYPDDANYVPGWSTLLDPDNCPTQFLPFLAQFNGTNVQPGTSDADARAIISSEPGFARGTLATLVTAVKRFLTGPQSVTIYERTAADGITADAYHFCIGIRSAQLVSLSGLTDAVNAAKPAGLQWSLLQSANWTINDIENAYASVTAVETTFRDVNHAETDVPG